MTSRTNTDGHRRSLTVRDIEIAGTALSGSSPQRVSTEPQIPPHQPKAATATYLCRAAHRAPSSYFWKGCYASIDSTPGISARGHGSGPGDKRAHGRVRVHRPATPTVPPRPWVTLCLKLKRMPEHRRIRCHYPPAPRLASPARLAAQAQRTPSISEISIPTHPSAPAGIVAGRRRVVVHRELRQQDRTRHHGGPVHRVRHPDQRLRAGPNHRRADGRAVVHRGGRQQDRADHHLRDHHPITLPTNDAYPWGITTGSDGALWFVEELGDQIGRISTSGTITEYALPTSGTYPMYITTGSDNNLGSPSRSETASGGSPPAERSLNSLSRPPARCPSGSPRARRQSVVHRRQRKGQQRHHHRHLHRIHAR